jgi:hypothetical protein
LAHPADRQRLCRATAGGSPRYLRSELFITIQTTKTLGQNMAWVLKKIQG